MTLTKLNFFRTPEEGNVYPDGLFKNAVTFMEYQTAIEASIEMLGARVSALPIILPVTASLYTATAALRAGGQPILIDIDASTHQMNASDLELALNTLQECVVVLTKPYGLDVNPKLLELTQNHVTVVVDDITCPPPSHSPVGTFDVFSLHARFDGAVVFSKYKKQVEDLKIVRSGTLGHHAEMSRGQSMLLRGYDREQEIWKMQCQAVCAKYVAALEREGLGDIILSKDLWASFPIKINSAQQLSSILSLSGVQVATGIVPLHFIPEIRQRYKEEPSYPIAESLADKVILLPVHDQVYDEDISIIVQDIKDHMR